MSPEPEEKLIVKENSKFGWCLGGEEADHENCRVRFGYYEFDYRCSCSCHDKKDLPALVRGKNHSPADPKFDSSAPKQRRKKSPPKA